MDSIKGYTLSGTTYKNGLFRFDMAVRNSDKLPVLIKSTSIKNLSAVKQLEHEYEMTQHIDNDWAVKALALEHSNDNLAIVFEDFEGESLDVFIKHSPLELNSFLKLAITITACISKMHEKGIIHKDIKPSNIKLNPKIGEIKIIDFSIASLLPTEHIQALPNPSTIEGTLPYLSPEQTGRMNRVVDSRSDLYSLGITFYEMLTGRLPFSAQDPLEWVYCHIAQTPNSPQAISPQIPKTVSDIIIKLMAKVAEERYQTASGLKYDLEKCLAELNIDEKIIPFLLGEKDISGKFQIVQKLYGRENELSTLLSSFNRVSETGESELVLISGYSGIGKTALVNELYKPIVKEAGFFISGKFDQYKRDIPYYTISDAFKSLIKNILFEPEDKIIAWKNLLTEALGINGQIIIDIIPQAELIIGKQLPLTTVSPMEAQIRFSSILEKFIRVFATQEHPLTIFLDDLQWTDSASLNLIKQLISNPENKYILLVGAYRDNEVTPSHPLMITLDEIRKQHTTINEITLQSLSQISVKQLIADSLNSELEITNPLAGLVHRKTDGNPFFIIQYLITLYKEQFLRFNTKTARWEWEIKEIEATEYTDNVVDLMVGKIKQLNVANQNMLKLAACIGNKFDRHLLSIISQQSENEVSAILKPSIEEGFLLSYNHTYEFLHDRIQQAAHSLLSEHENSQTHCKIGKLLLESTPEEELEENIFIIVNHLSHSPDCIDDLPTQLNVAHLNLHAGKKARASSAYHSAKSYFLSGIELLPQKSWKTEHELSFQLHLELSTCEYLLGNFHAAEKLFDTILSELQSPVEMAKVYNVRLELLQTLGKFEEAVILGLKALQTLDLPFPETDTDQSAYAELLQVQEQLQGVIIEDLLNKPSMTDPVYTAAMAILMNLMGPFYNARPHLLGLLTFRMTNYSLQYGNTASSPYAYLYYGIILGTGMGDYKQGQEFGEMALALNDKQEHKEMSCKVLQTYGGLVHPWSNPIHTSSSYLNKSYLAGLETGDLIFSGFAVGVNTYLKIMCGQDLQSIYTEAEKFISFFKRSKDEMMLNAHRVFMQQCLNLMGHTSSAESLSTEDYNEELVLAEMHEKQFAYSFNCYYIVKMQLHYHNGNYKEAIDTANKIKDYVALVHFAQLTVTEFCFYYALTLAALYPTVTDTERAEYLELLKAEQDKMKKWAENCPENFQHKYLLISAELEYILNENSSEIMAIYEEAIKSARENKFVQNVALAYELASTYYTRKGYKVIAESYLREAKNGYARWGAKAKVNQLDKKHPSLKEQQSFTSVDSIGNLTVQHLDLHTIIKASQTISSPLDLKELTGSLMRIVMEQTGARKGVLLLEQNNQFTIAAESVLNGDIQIKTYDVFEPPRPDFIPEKIIQYVKRTQETVILENASENDTFNMDSYVTINQAKSIISLPIIKQAKLIGILYLENNLFTGAFTDDKIDVLELLASQAAISIENAIAFMELNFSEIKLKEFKHFFNNTEDFCCIANTEGYFEILNPNFEKILGYTEKELLENQFLTFVHPDDIDATLKEVEKLKTGAITINFKNRYRKKDGTYLWFDWNTTPNPVTGKLYAIARDITMQKQAEAELQASEARFKRFAEISSEAVVIHDEGKIIEVNPAFGKMFGYEEAEVIGMHASQFAAPESIDLLREKLEEKSTQPSEGLSLRKDGSTLYIELKGRKINYKGQDRTVTTILDVTRRKTAENELRESEEKFRLLAETTNIIPWESDAKTFQFTYVGPQAEKILGYAPSEWYTTDFWQNHIYPDDKKQALDYCLESYKTKKDYDFEYRMVAADGSTVWIHDIVTVVTENGKPVLLRGFLIDITARKNTDSKVEKLNIELKQAVIELREAEQELRTESEYVELLQNVAAAANEPNTIEEIVQIALDKICKLTKWPLGHLYLINENKPDKLYSTTIWHLEDSKRFGNFKKITEATDFELGIGLPGRVWKSKTPAWIPDVSIDLNFPRNKASKDIGVKAGFAFSIMVGDNVVGVLEFFSHEIIEKPNERLLEVSANIGTMLGRVIERNQTSEKLRKGEASLSQAQQLAHIGSWEWDFIANKMEWSDELYRIFGFSAQVFEANYENYLKYIHHEDKEYVAGIVQQAMKDHKPFNFFHKIILQDGTQRIISSRGNVFTDSNNNVIKMTGTSQDVTEMKQAELEIQKLNSELEQRVVDRTAQLLAANKELEAFSYSVSHDLRAPLRAISGYSKILKEDYISKLDDDGESILNAILKNSKKMNELIDDLLAFSRLGRTEIITTEIDMDTLVQSVIEDEMALNTSKIEFKKNKLQPNNGVEPLIKQVWINLISNAIKYSKHNPKPIIEIGSYHKDNFEVYYVKDNGAGFDMQYYDKLFGVFQRLHSDEEFEGTGIGLAIVQKIIQRHNGTVWAESKVNEGACFYFTIPKTPIDIV